MSPYTLKPCHRGHITAKYRDALSRFPPRSTCRPLGLSLLFFFSIRLSNFATLPRHMPFDSAPLSIGVLFAVVISFGTLTPCSTLFCCPPVKQFSSRPCPGNPSLSGQVSTLYPSLHGEKRLMQQIRNPSTLCFLVLFLCIDPNLKGEYWGLLRE